MDLEGRGRKIPCDFTHAWNLKTKLNCNIPIDTEKRLVVTVWEGLGRWKNR